MLRHFVESLWYVPFAGAFGLSAIWLLGSRLAESDDRVGNGLRMLVSVSVCSAFCFVMTGLWDQGFSGAFVPLLILPVSLALNVALSIILCGLVLRRSYSALRFMFFYGVILIGVSFVFTLPAYAVSKLVAPSSLPSPKLIECVFPLGCVIALASFTTSAPFLVLAAFNRFYRERVKALCSLQE